MRIVVVGARGQLGAAIVARVPRGARRGGARRAPTLDVTDDRGGRRGDGARRGPTRSSTAPATTTWTAPRTTRSRRSNVNAFAVRALARAAGRARRDARPLQHRFRVRRHRDGAVHRGRSAQSRRACTPRRSCSASGSPPTRRALRAARREPVRARPAAAREGQRRGIVEGAAGRRGRARVRGSDGVADLRA